MKASVAPILGTPKASVFLTWQVATESRSPAARRSAILRLAQMHPARPEEAGRKRELLALLHREA